MDNLPAIIDDSNQEGKINQAFAKIRSEIENIWTTWHLVSESKEADDLGYLRSFLKNTQDSLPVISPDNYECPEEVKKALSSLTEYYKEVAELIRARIKELNQELRNSDLKQTLQNPPQLKENFEKMPKRGKRIKVRRTSKKGWKYWKKKEKIVF